MKPVVEHTSERLIKRLAARDKHGALAELAALFEGTDHITGSSHELLEALEEREKILSTGIGLGIAVPHAKIAAVRRIGFAVGVSPEGIDYDSMDGKPVHLVVVVIAGEQEHKDYLKLLAQIMTVVKDEATRQEIIAAETAADILAIFAR